MARSNGHKERDELAAIGAGSLAISAGMPTGMHGDTWDDMGPLDGAYVYFYRRHRIHLRQEPRDIATYMPYNQKVHEERCRMGDEPLCRYISIAKMPNWYV